MSIPVFAPEFLLMSHIQNLGRKIASEQALIFKLSRLDPVTKKNRRQFIELEKVAHDHFGPNINYFQMSNFDVVIVGTNLVNPNLAEFIAKTVLVFGGDSFIATIDRSHFQNLCQAVVLSKDYKTFNTYMITSYNRLRPSNSINDSPLDLISGHGDDDKNLISLQKLSSFEQPLVSTDLSAVSRRQDICLIDNTMKMRIVMSEVFVSIVDLAEGFVSTNSITSNPWLFMHLTSILDKRMLAFLRAHDDSRFRSSISINLNISSFFSSSFHNFDRFLNQANRETIMFELQLVDIITNLDKFYIARDTLKEKGYRFCIDSLPYTHLEFIDDDIFGLDMVKINASGKFRSLDRPTLINTVRRIDELGSDKFILCRCDDKETIEFGQKMNIKLFQGYFIDNYRQAVAEKLAEEQRKRAIEESKNKPMPSRHPRAIRPS